MKQEQTTSETEKVSLDPWLLFSYAILACFLWIAVFYLTGNKWWNHPLTP